MSVSPAGKGTSPSVLKGDLGVDCDGLRRKCGEKGGEWRAKGKERKGVPLLPVSSSLEQNVRRWPSLTREGRARRQEDPCAVQCRF